MRTSSTPDGKVGVCVAPGEPAASQRENGRDRRSRWSHGSRTSAFSSVETENRR